MSRYSDEVRQIWCVSIAPRLRCSQTCLLGYCGGVWIPVFVPELWPNHVLLTLVSVSLLLVLNNRLWLLPLCFLIGLAWASYHFSEHQSYSFPASYERVDLALNGAVTDLPQRQGNDLRFRFLIEEVVGHSDLDKLQGQQIQLACYRCSLEIEAGQHWSLTVRLKRPHGYASWGAFDYEKYLFRHRIIARGYVRLKSRNEFRHDADFDTHRWRHAIRQKLPEGGADSPGASIIAALAIGDKSGFDRDQRQVFQDTGVSHLMAISGLHVGLVFMAMRGLCGCLLWPVARVFNAVPRQYLVLMPALISATLYSALAGFAVSTQRALIMLLVYVLCRLWVRDASLSKVLLVAATAILIYDPFSILDIGFWLSCGAVAIIALASTTNKRLGLMRLQPILWLGMLPLSLLFFGQTSIVSPLVNLVAVPLFCLLLIPATLLVLVIMQIGLESVAYGLFAILIECFDWVYQGLHWVSSLPAAHWHSPPLSWWQWSGFALAIAATLVRLPGKTCLWLAVLLSIFVSSPISLKPDQIRLALLDVGQGLAIVLHTPDSVTVYDTGPRYNSGFTAAEAVLLPYLRANGVGKIDTLIVSHADNDHIGGLDVVVEAFEVERVISSRPDRISYAERCVAGQRWQQDNTLFQFISPDTATPKGSNNHSCVLMVEHRGVRMLISGDIEKQVERYLVEQSRRETLDLRADILLVPHQGSKTSSTPEFIDAVSPELALVAAGYLNHYGHPHEVVVERYQRRRIPLLSTVDHGSVVIDVGSGGWSASSYRDIEQRFWHYQKVSNRKK